MPKYTENTYGGEDGHSGGWSLVAIVVALGLLGLGGWWLYQRTLENRLPAVSFGVAYDVSHSMTLEEKQRSAGVLTRALDEIFADEVYVKTWRFAEEVREVDERNLVKSSELNPIYEKKIFSTLGKWGTKPSLALQDLFDFAKEPRNQNRPVVLCIFTDGEIVVGNNPQQADLQQTEAERQTVTNLASQIAKLQNVKAVVIGPVKEEFRREYQKLCAPLKEANKLVLFGETDAQRAVEEVVQAIRQ